MVQIEKIFQDILGGFSDLPVMFLIGLKQEAAIRENPYFLYMQSY